MGRTMGMGEVDGRIVGGKLENGGGDGVDG